MATQEQQLITVIRRATDADLHNISLLIQSFVKNGEVLPRTLQELSTLIETFFVAEQSGEIVGCVSLEIFNWKLAEVRSLCVAESARNQGIGKKLVEACIQYAESQNVLEVMAITHSENFFVSCGFDYTLPNLKKALFIQTGVLNMQDNDQ